MSRARTLANYGDGLAASEITSGVLPVGVTGGSGLTALGTVTSGTISTGAVIDDPTMTQGSDATGDVYYRAATGKLTRLATGADGTVLTSTGAGAVPAFEAVTAAAAGHVVKVTQYLNTSDYTTTGTTPKRGPTSGTITMDSTSNKMFITVTFLASVTSHGMRVALYRNPTVSSGDTINGGVNLTPGTEPQVYIGAGSAVYVPLTYTYLDTPAANSTYGLVYYEHSSNPGNSEIYGALLQTSFTFMEVKV